MFDTWFDNIELTSLTLILALCVVLPAQLLLCFKAKRLILRLLPTLLTAAAAVVLLILAAAFAPGWDALAYLIFAILALVLLLASGVGWAVWLVYSMIGNRK